MKTNLTPIFDRLDVIDREIASFRAEVTEFKDEILTGMDAIMVILKRMDRAQTIANERIRIVEVIVEEHDGEIHTIKRHLSLK